MDTIEIKIPLSDKELDKYFDTIEDYQFIIVLKASEYHGKSLLNYIYNTNMHCDFKTEQWGEELAELAEEYIKTDKLLSIPMLNTLWINLIRYHIDHNFQIKDETYRTFLVDFYEKHIDLVQKLAEVLSSLKIFLMNIMVEAEIEAEEKDVAPIGNNMISLREEPYFWQLLSDLDQLQIPYAYYPHFESTSYDGYKIAHYYYDEFSPLSVIKICCDLFDAEKQEE